MALSMSSNGPPLRNAVAEQATAGWGRLVVALAITVLALRGLMYWNFRPIWDGALYVECLAHGAEQLTRGANIADSLNCFSHPSMGYMGVLAPAWLLGGLQGLLIANLALAGAAVWAVWRSATIVAPGQPLTVALAALGYSMQPMLLANAVNFTADHGVTCFMALVIWTLLAKRTGLTVGFGLLLSFSKETGGALYAIAASCSGLALLVQCEGPLKARLAAVLRLWPLALPTVAFLAFMAWMRFFSDAGLWEGTSESSLLSALTSLHINAVVGAYLLGLLVLNFAWLFVIPLLLWPAARLLPPATDPLPTALGPTSPQEARLFLILLLIGSAWLLTRFETFLNPRYLFGFTAVLTLCGVAALNELIRVASIRNAILGVVAGLLLVSNYRTIDPLSRAEFGTFQFGRHALLKMTAATGECCGYGRDQLQYNMQFTALSYLTDDALRALKATEATPLYLAPMADWNLLGPVDSSTHQATLQLDRFPPKTVWAEPFAGVPGYYLAYPNVPSETDLALLSRCGDIGPPLTFTRNGYAIEVRKLLPRPDAPADCQKRD